MRRDAWTDSLSRVDCSQAPCGGEGFIKGERMDKRVDRRGDRRLDRGVDRRLDRQVDGVRG